MARVAARPKRFAAKKRKEKKGFADNALHCPAYVSIRQHTPAYVSIRQHTSAYVSIRQAAKPDNALLQVCMSEN